MTNAPKPPLGPPSRPGETPTVGMAPVLDAPESGTPPPSKIDALVGKTIDGRYLVERILGEGGMGIVYAARHKVIGKRVAIKVLRGEMATDSDVNERFLQEARAASAIGNPHIIDISDFGQLPDGSTYFVMEFLDGKSLSQIVSEGTDPIPVPRLCHIAKQMAQGLAAAHAANIVHRDLKPDNVMLINRGTEKDFVKILDFGIAKVGGLASKVTRAGSVFGTPHYMSPEQAAGAAVDHRTDIYALGVILYEMACGKVPFDADNFMGILTQHMYKAPVPIRALVPEVDVPPGLDAIVLKCLTKKPEGRYETMDQLVADLEKLDHGVLPDAVQEMMARSGGFNVPADYFRSTAMPAPVPASPVVPIKRWPLYAVIAAVATGIGVIGIVVIGKSASSTASTRPPAPIVATAAPLATATTVAPIASATAAVTLAPVSTTREVLVSVAPSDAVITRDGKDVGPQPVELHLADGERASLVIARKGYKSKMVTVDGKEARQSFALDSMYGAPAPNAGAAKPAAGSRFGGIDDVGDPFAKH
ncbi:MAG: serine/threonine protein kinase [Polyangiaceae bacterium]|jgi:eukaryotic-like serine/threonine-protein kinase